MHGRELRVEGSPNPIHWFGPIDSVPERYPDAEIWTPRGVRWSATAPPRQDEHGNDVSCGLWRVSTYGASATRSASNGLSLTLPQLNGTTPPPAGTSVVQRPAPVWVEIHLASSAGRSIIIDAGQTIFVYATTLTVSWWAPGPLNPANAGVISEWIEVPGNGSQPMPVPNFAETLASEGVIYCQIARVEEARQQGQDYALLTQSYFVEASLEIDQYRPIPIPTGARRLYATRDNTGAVVDTRFAIGFSNGTGGGGFQQIGTIPINDSQSVDGPQLFPNATHVFLPILAEPVLWSLTWEIAP